MATLPNMIAPTVAPNNDGGQFSAPQMNDAPGRELAMLGRGMGHVADVMFRMEDTANRARETDALNQVIEAEQRLEFDREKGFRSAKGLNALQRPNDESLENEFGGALESEIQRISRGLGNNIQRERFLSQAGQRLTAFRGRAMKHEVSEFQNYHRSVYESDIKNRINDIGLKYDDPSAIDENAAYIKSSAHQLAQMLGYSAEWTEAHTRKSLSDAYKTAIVSAVENGNPTYAAGLFDRYSKDMDADDLLRVRGLVTKGVNQHIGIQAANSIYNDRILPSVSPSDSSRAFNVAVGTESNHQQFAKDGKPLESTIIRNGRRVEGAIGIAQVMRGTGPEAAKLAGLPWDENRWKNDAEYNYTIGKAYFDQQLKTFGGDVAKAWAAYNAGPGAVGKAIKREQDEGKSWLSFLPKETQDYVQKNSAKFSQGGGRPAKMTEEDVERQLRADPVLSQNPEAMKIARDEAVRLLDLRTKAEKQRGDEALTSAYDILSRNGGDINGLPQTLLEQVPADKRDSLMTYAEKMSKGAQITDDLAVYQDVRERIARGETVNLLTYQDKLSHSTLKQLTDMQTKARSGNGPLVAEWQLKRAYGDLGISNKARQGELAKYVEDQARLVEKAKGREPTYDEIEVIIKGAMTQTDQGWFGGRELYRVYGTPEFDSAQFQIPSAVRREIEAQLDREGMPRTNEAVYDRFQRAMRIGPYSPANMRRAS